MVYAPKPSGAEPLCKFNVFSMPHGIVRNNCYAYALQIGSKRGPYNYKLQPGDLSSKKYFDLDSCHDVRDRVIDDLKVIGGYMVKTLEKPCKPGHYLIAMILSKDRDYHFLVFHNDIRYVVEAGETRQSIARKFHVPVSRIERRSTYTPGTVVCIRGANVWSHKRGTAEPPTLLDSNGKIIKDPRKSKFNYGFLDYNTFCTFFCVRRQDQGPSTIRNSANGLVVSRVNKQRKRKPTPRKKLLG